MTGTYTTGTTCEAREEVILFGSVEKNPDVQEYVIEIDAINLKPEMFCPIRYDSGGFHKAAPIFILSSDNEELSAQVRIRIVHVSIELQAHFATLGGVVEVHGK